MKAPARKILQELPQHILNVCTVPKIIKADVDVKSFFGGRHDLVGKERKALHFG